MQSSPSSSRTQSKASVRDPLKMKIAGLLLSLIMRVLYYTSRKTFIDRHHLETLFEQGQPIILASWHNRNVLAPFAYLSIKPRTRGFVALASASKDGGLATWAMRGFGIHCIRGSSSKGGFAALKTLMSALKKGQDVGFTPDGPRGPVYQVNGGVITAAKMTGAAIMPVTYQAKRRKQLRSWDRFIVPYPFNRLRFVYGQPILVPRTCPANDIDAYAADLREELLRIDAIAEQFES